MRVGLIIPMMAVVALMAACEGPEEVAEFRVDGSVLHVSGTLDSSAHDRFLDTIEDHPGITRLHLGLIDGSSDDEANMPLYHAVRDMGLETFLSAHSEVYSGGADLFISGKTRRMERGAVIGVHSWSDGTRDAADFPKDAPEHALHLALTKKMLGSEDWYWFTIQAAPAEGMHTMTEAEIQEYGLLTGPIIDPN